MTINDIVNELKTKIINTLNLEGVSPEDIDADAQLVGGELGIDSIDVLELVLMMEREYGIAIKSRELGAQVFATLTSMAAYINEQSPELTH